MGVGPFRPPRAFPSPPREPVDDDEEEERAANSVFPNFSLQRPASAPAVALSEMAHVAAGITLAVSHVERTIPRHRLMLASTFLRLYGKPHPDSSK